MQLQCARAGVVDRCRQLIELGDVRWGHATTDGEANARVAQDGQPLEYLVEGSGSHAQFVVGLREPVHAHGNGVGLA